MNVERGEKVALILEGGGMRAGFVAGVLMALLDNGITHFDEALAVSASVPTLAYFLAGQRLEMEAVWRHELCTSKLVCYRNIPAASLALSPKRPVLDIDYLIYDVFKKKYPLDIQQLRKLDTLFHFAATNVLTGEMSLLGIDHGDIYDIFRACLAVPGCYPVTVRIGNDHFVDGGTVNPLPASYLLNRGGRKKIVAVLTKPLGCEGEPPSIFERTLFWRYFHRHEWMLDKLWEAAQSYGEEVARLETMAEEDPPRALIITPQKIPPAKFITRDRRKINRTIDMGYKKAMAMITEISSFCCVRRN